MHFLRLLCVDALLEVVQIDPALRFRVQLRRQPFLLVRERLQPDIVAAADLLLLFARGQLCFELRNHAVDRVKFPLLVVGEFQLLLTRTLRNWFFLLFGLLFLRGRPFARPVGPVAGKHVDAALRAHLEDGVRQLVEEEAVV